ncbi:MAG: pyruvate, phosphate dikinase [Planctomycetota bacterium]
MPNKRVYFFAPGDTEGDAHMRELLGGKGANLAEMTSIGLPVPPGFTITTATCAAYHDADGTLPGGVTDEIEEAIHRLQAATGKRFGDVKDPLLVSVRSGAAVSMPGMMDTILNLGLNDLSVEGLARSTGNPRFAYDAYRRLINMFGEVVMGIHHDEFEHELDNFKRSIGVLADTDVPARGMVEICERYKLIYRRFVDEPFPQDPRLQLRLAVEAVFKSWQSSRAKAFRRIANITGLRGTAVNVQAMAYGNTGEDSATGVAFTRNPSTGENTFYGEFLINAQGEDVVAGIRTPMPVDGMKKWNKGVYDQLIDIKNLLESHYADMQDIEFTVERGTLYMLQTRNGKRTGPAAVRIECEMVQEGVLTKEQALLRVPAGDLTQLLLPSFDAASKKKAKILTKGLPASPGAAVGMLAFTADEAVDRARKGETVILVRHETSPEDVEGMHTAIGVLTTTGGMTSHAAVVARGWGKCCVAGAGEIRIDEKKGKITVAGVTLGRSDLISIDGSTGEVMQGEVKAPPPKMSPSFKQLMSWADDVRTLEVRTNADTPADAKRAREFGARGIGLCRTEHMFFEANRIAAVRRMILAEHDAERTTALAELLPHQRKDFEGIFRAMDGLPVTIRLLDPPLHEFLPRDDYSQKEVAASIGETPEWVKQRVTQMQEANPMLGHRGCRLAVTYPEILAMQVRAIVEAAINVAGDGVKAMPEIMVPLISTDAELASLRKQIERTIELVKAERRHRGKLAITIGTMIEVPRAALVAGRVAEYADFFSFGTNDLTQLAFGFSRDDVNTFLPTYLEQEILAADPFQSLDTGGVGQLVELGVERGRTTKPDLKVGICGEHGGDPDSVAFCHRLGLDYVSCSPFRVPIARLAAAQAALRE